MIVTASKKTGWLKPVFLLQTGELSFTIGVIPDRRLPSKKKSSVRKRPIDLTNNQRG
ncbi:hypothetical protein [Gracilibacillus sp. Marseille-QA3620]